MRFNVHFNFKKADSFYGLYFKHLIKNEMRHGNAIKSESTIKNIYFCLLCW